MIPFYPEKKTPEDCGITVEDVAKGGAFVLMSKNKAFWEDVRDIEKICTADGSAGRLMLRIVCVEFVRSMMAAFKQAAAPMRPLPGSEDAELIKAALVVMKHLGENPEPDQPEKDEIS